MSLAASLTLAEPPLVADACEMLADRRIFFAHQSLGAEILEELQTVTDGTLAVREGRSVDRFVSAGLVHTSMGAKETPDSMLAEFEEVLDAVGGRVDFAIFEFFSLDFDVRSDVDRLFQSYLATMARLRAKYPAVLFVHLTVPLTVVPRASRSYAAHAPGGVPANEARDHFNMLLRTGRQTHPLFDLAAHESTHADGTVCTFDFGGVRFPALASEYAAGGQHLNAVGRRSLAEALLIYLARLL
jgi:hypothetical protein